VDSESVRDTHMPNEDAIRIFRSPRAAYYGDEPLESPAVYDDRELAGIAAEGFNGIWLRAVLRDLVPTELFARHVRRDAQRIEGLRTLAQRAARHGVGVWLYLNEPMTLPADHPFWAEHPECRGLAGQSRMDGWDETWAMCTSAPPVVRFLRQAGRELFTRVPELAGVILITAAEHHTHCYSHISTRGPGTPFEPRAAQACPRCKQREPAEVICELIGAISAGIHEASPSAKVAAWTWRWSQFYDEPHEQIISRLPQDVLLLSNFEDGQELPDRPGAMPCQEYSLAVVGPSPLFEAQARLARSRGLGVMAKLQIGTTHELATVPNLPALPSVYRKLRWIGQHKLAGYMGTWNFGCKLTVNTAAAAKAARARQLPEERQFLAELCREYFAPGADEHDVVRAWYGFHEALQHHPLSLKFLYFGPLNYALAFPWPAEKGTRRMGRNWTGDEWGDRLEDTLPPYTMQQMLELLDRLAEGWQRALSLYRRGLQPVADKDPRARRELASAQYAGASFRSCANLYRWYAGLLADKPDPDLIERELNLCNQALDLLEEYPDLGFHQECQLRQCSPQRVRRKIEKLEELRRARSW